MSDPVQLWANGIVEFRIDLRDGKFLMTPIMRDKSEGAVLDAPRCTIFCGSVRMTANHPRPSPSEIAEKVRRLGAPLKRNPEGEFILDRYIYLAMTLDLAKDTLSDESAPDDAKVLAQAIVGISAALELQRLRALDDLSTN